MPTPPMRPQPRPSVQPLTPMGQVSPLQMMMMQRMTQTGMSGGGYLSGGQGVPPITSGIGDAPQPTQKSVDRPKPRQR